MTPEPPVASVRFWLGWLPRRVLATHIALKRLNQRLYLGWCRIVAPGCARHAAASPHRV